MAGKITACNASHGALIQVLAAPASFQLPANDLGKAEEMAQVLRAPVPMWEM